MSSYLMDNKHKTTISDASTLDALLYQGVEALIQALKNNQRCYAEAASLVNSSALRTFFEKIELERTIFMEKIARSLDRNDLIVGKSSQGADVVWFASVEFTNISKEAFDFGILLRCIQCEDALYQAYTSTITLRKNSQSFLFLNEQKKSLHKVSKQLKRLKKQHKA